MNAHMTMDDGLGYRKQWTVGRHYVILYKRHFPPVCRSFSMSFEIANRAFKASVRLFHFGYYLDIGRPYRPHV